SPGRRTPAAGTVHPVRQHVGVVLFRDDGVPRPARLRRAGGLRDYPPDGGPRPADAGQGLGAGEHRAVLALCRYRVDLPVPAAVSGITNCGAASRLHEDSLRETNGMAETHVGHAHHGPKVQVYLVVGLALAVFTIVSFVVNSAVRSHSLTTDQGFWIILTVAVVKATLV